LSTILLLTSARETPADILPSLTLLPHVITAAPAAAGQAAFGPPPDAVLVDARRDLMLARRVVQTLRTIGMAAPVLVIVTDGGWAAVSADWGADDVILHTAGPAEVEARLRLAISRKSVSGTPATPDEIRSSGLVVNETTYSARMNGRSLDLTFKEFELLKFLAQHPGRVFSRAQLLQEVWGYDYFGGTRTVDVHVRRLRAKLGAENEALIGTVRNVGYRFVPVKGSPAPDSPAPDSPAAEPAAAEPAAAEPAAAEPAPEGGPAATRPPGQVGDGARPRAGHGPAGPGGPLAAHPRSGRDGVPGRPNLQPSAVRAD
jgi:DNA-binding response OmpR family regulator